MLRIIGYRKIKHAPLSYFISLDIGLFKTLINKYLACRNGWYGPDCGTPCGHCFGSDICHHINGSCPGNCTDGYYTGEKCIDGELYFI